MSIRRRMTRREFLQFSGGLAAAAALAACAPATTAPAAPTAASAAATKPAAATAPPASKYKEAPALAELVKAGKLPPVEQRLPKTPMVITPNESVGVYGGRWRSGLLGKADTAWLSRTIGNEPLLRWAPDIKNVLPNLAE